MIKQLFIRPLKFFYCLSVIVLVLVSLNGYAQTVTVPCETTTNQSASVLYNPSGSGSYTKYDGGTGYDTVYYPSASSITRAYAVFNLAAYVPAAATITGVTLNIYGNRSGSASTNYCVTTVTASSSDTLGFGGTQTAQNVYINIASGTVANNSVQFFGSTTPGATSLAFTTAGIAILQGTLGSTNTVSVGMYLTAILNRYYIIAGQSSANPPSLTVTYTLNCSGTPTASAVSPATAALTICTGPSQTFTLPAYSGVGGLTYQWQQSTNGGTSYTAIAGATNATYTGSFLSGTTLINAVVTCTSSGSSTTASPATVINSTAYFPVVTGSGYFQGFESTWINQCGTDDAPDTYWKNTPVTGNRAWRRDDDGSSANWTSPTYGAFTPTGSNANGASSSHSARFHSSYITSPSNTGVFDVYLNLSAAGTKQLSYDYINGSTAGGMVTVSISTNGPAGPFTQLDQAVTSASWTTRMATTSVTGANCVLRFVGTPDYGSYDIGLDNVSVSILNACNGTITGAGISPAASTLSYCGNAPATTLSLTGYSGTTGLTYQWKSSTDSVTFTPISNATSAAYTTASQAATTYYRVVVACTASGSMDSASTSVTVRPVPVVTLIPATVTICAGGSVTLTAAGANTYTYSPTTGLNPTTGASVTASPAATTTYTVAGTASNGCTATASSVVSVTPAPLVTSTVSPNSACIGGSAILTTTAVSSYNVSSIGFGLATQTSPVAATTGDDANTTVTLPFTFTFYGVPYTSLNINTNGLVYFGATTSTYYSPSALPSTGASGEAPIEIDLFHSDLSTGGSGSVTYSTEGTAPNRSFVISYNSVPGLSNGSVNTGQIILRETSNLIDLEIDSSTASIVKTAGIQNYGLSLYTAVPGENGVAYAVTTPQAWRFAQPATTYTYSPAANLSNTSLSTDTATNLAAFMVYTITVTNTQSNCATTKMDTIRAGAQGTWAGTTSTDYGTATNWYCGVVPTATDSIVIPAGTTYAPIIAASATFNGAAFKLATNATLVINAGATLSIAGPVVDSGIQSGSTGTIILNGTTSQPLSGNGRVSNITLNNTAGAVIASGSNINVVRTLTMNAGTLTTNGGLTLFSTSAATARVAAITGGSISGNVNVQQYIPGGRRAFRFLGHPFSSSIPLSQLEASIDITGAGGSANGFTTTQNNNPSAFYYNPLTGNGSTTNDIGWTPFTGTDGTGVNAWNPYEGIRVLVRGTQGQGLDGNTYTPSAATFTMAGPLNQGAITEAMTVGANSNYNVLSNPYPSPTDIGTVIGNANTAGYISGSGYYVWNANSQTAGAYVVQTVGSGAYSIPANTSFVVAAQGTNPVLTFAETNKTAAATTALLKANDVNNMVQLNLYDSNGSLWDRSYINFNGAANAAVDNMDAKKLHNTGLDFYSYSSDDQKLSIDARPFVTGNVIPLGLVTSVPQQFTIKVDGYAVPAGGQLFLHDKYLGVYTPLSEGTEYSFAITTDAATQGDNRFELGMSGETTAVSSVASNSFDMTMTPNPATEQVVINFSGSKAEATTVSVMDVTGKKIMTQNLGVTAKGSVTLPLSNLASGMYMVELNAGSALTTRKLVKQ